MQLWRHFIAPVIIAAVSTGFLLGPMLQPTVADAATFAVTDLGTLGGDSSSATAINDQRQVTGVSSRASGPSHVFLWSAGTMTDLGEPPCVADCATSTWVANSVAINSNGRIAGSVSRVQAFGWLSWGFTYSTGWTDLGGPTPCGMEGQIRRWFYSALGLNDSGDAVGYWECSIGDTPEGTFPVLWQGGAFQFIGDETFMGQATAINNAGKVVGHACSFPCPPGGAFLYQNGQISFLPALVDGPYSFPNAINDSGGIVGSACVAVPCGGGHAVLWMDNQIHDLGTLPGDTYSAAVGISRDREIIGTSGSSHFMLATLPDAGAPILQDLNQLIAGTGWTLLSVAGINNLGQIVGTGQMGSTIHAILLDPIMASSANLSRASRCPTPQEKEAEARLILAFSVAALPVPDLNIAVLTEQAVQAISNKIRNDLFCHGDPFDFNFRTTFAPQFQSLPQVQATNCIPDDLVPIANAALNHVGRSASYTKAMGVTRDRAQSAFTFADTQSFGLQDQTLGSYTDSLVGEFTAAQSGVQMIAQRLVGSPCDVSITLDQIRAFQDDVRSRGVDALDPLEVQIFSTFGINPQALVDLILSVDPTQVPTGIVNIFNQTAQLYGDLADLYR